MKKVGKVLEMRQGQVFPKTACMMEVPTDDDTPQDTWGCVANHHACEIYGYLPLPLPAPEEHRQQTQDVCKS